MDIHYNLTMANTLTVQYTNHCALKWKASDREQVSVAVRVKLQQWSGVLRGVADKRWTRRFISRWKDMN